MNDGRMESCRQLKIVGFLARNHGLNALEELLRNDYCQVVCVFTHALNPKSEDEVRGQRKELELYKALAAKHRFQLISVDSVEDAKQIDHVFGEIGMVDFIVSVSWRRLVLKRHLEMARLGALNLHRGKLPEYAGAEPVKRAILDGKKSVHITAHLMTEVIDNGEVIAEVEYPIHYDNHKSVSENVSDIKEQITRLFGPLLSKSLSIMASGQMR